MIQYLGICLEKRKTLMNFLDFLTTKPNPEQDDLSVKTLASGIRQLTARLNFAKRVGFLRIEQYSIDPEVIETLPDLPNGKDVAQAVLLQAVPLKELDATVTRDLNAGSHQFRNLLDPLANVVIIRAKTAESVCFDDLWTLVSYIDK